jgi:outer membrane protein TolC
MNLLPALLVLLTPGFPQADAPLSVDDAVRLARTNSPKLRAARFEAQAAQTETDREKPVARPTVTAQAIGTLQGPRVTFPRDGEGDATVLPERFGRVELMVEQVLYRPGLGAARERYAAQTRANVWDYRRTENDVIQEVRRAYFNLLTAQTMAEVARGGVETARKHLDLVKLMLEAGQSSERDEKAADADLAEAEQGAIKAENGVALARADLNRLMGRDLASSLTTSSQRTLEAVPDGPEAGIALALARRPEIRQLEENLRAARAGVSLARTQAQPSLSARATAARQTPSAFTNDNYYAAGLVITWNLLDAGKTRADVQEARARVGQLEALLEETKLGIRLEVEKAWRDMREARARIAAAVRQVAAAQAALDVSELRYQQRAATQLEVSGAIFSVTKALANQAQAVFDLNIAAADYAHATGADVKEDVEPPSFPRKREHRGTEDAPRK